MRSDKPPPRPPSQTDVVRAIKRIARAQGFLVAVDCQQELIEHGHDVISANELIANCMLADLDKWEPDYHPKRSNWVAVLKLRDGPRRLLYVKIRLHMPGMTSGDIKSFHVWGRQ